MRFQAIFAAIAAVGAGACAFNQSSPIPPGPDVFQGETHSAVAPPPPVSGGTLAVVQDPHDDASVWVVAAVPEADEIHVVTIRRPAYETPPRRDIALEPGDEPGRVVGDPSGRAHVALRGSGDLVTIDAATGAILARRHACPSPRGLAYDAAIDAVHVACTTGELVTLPARGGDAIRRVVLDRDLRDVVVLPSSPASHVERGIGARPSKLLVSRFRSAEILRVDASGAIETRMPAPGSNLRQAHVAWRMSPTADGAVLSYQMEKTTPIDITQPASGTSAPYGSSSPGLNPDDPNGPIVMPVVATANEAGIQPMTMSPILFGSSPTMDVAVAADGKIAVAAGSVVALADRGPFVQKLGEPWQLPASYRQVTAVAFVELGVHPLVASLWRGGPPGYEVGLVFFSLDGNAPPHSLQFSGAADTGLDIFQTPTKGGIACASCHPEGGDDGHTWTFRTADGRRTRRTQSLRGGILATAPFHWDGDMPGMRAICDGVFSGRMGGDHVDDAQLAILQRFLDSIPRLPPRAGLEAARVDRGRALFEGKGGCSGCHSGDHFTSNASADVGKGVSLQIPQLVSIGDRAPFMHDGCAATLMDRFDPACGGAAHGNQNLSGDEKRDLVEFLETL